MVQKWITKKDGNENKHIRIETDRKAREVQVQDIGPTPAQLETQAWNLLGDLSKITTVDQLLLQMRKYSGTLGDYLGFNSLLIGMQDPNATIVRSRNEWKYFGREVNDGALPISVLYPVGVAHKDGPGKVKDFIEKKRKEGLSDEAIEELVRATTLYNTLKKIAKDHYTVEEETILNGAHSYTAHSGEGQIIVVIKIPGEDVNVLHTPLIHELSHANLEHFYRKDLPRGVAESEAEFSTYLVGAHFGLDFRDGPSVYIKGWLDNAKSQGKDLGKENLDRVMNNARWLINEISKGL